MIDAQSGLSNDRHVISASRRFHRTGSRFASMPTRAAAAARQQPHPPGIDAPAAPSRAGIQAGQYRRPQRSSSRHSPKAFTTGRRNRAIAVQPDSATARGTPVTTSRRPSERLRCRARDCRAREPDIPRRIADFLLGDETFAPAFPGLLRYLGVDRDGAVPPSGRERVRRVAGRGALAAGGYCPTCGSCPRWRSWSASIPGGCGCCRAAAAARAGSSSEPAARSVKPTRSGCERDHRGRAGTAHRITANPAAATSRPTTDRATKPVALGLVVTPSRSDRARSRTETAGGVALRVL